MEETFDLMENDEQRFSGVSYAGIPLPKGAYPVFKEYPARFYQGGEELKVLEESLGDVRTHLFTLIEK